MITSPHNPVIKHVHALQSKRREREQEAAFVVEGIRLVEEAVRAEAPARLALYTLDLDERGRALLSKLEALGARVEAVSPEAMAAASDTQTPSGLLAVVAMPAYLVVPRPALALVADRVSDPGNLGTLLRTADAAGVESVSLMPETVDAYNPKVVRAAMGAHFHLPIAEARWETLAGGLGGAAAWLAEARGGQAYDQVDWRPPSALIVSSEADGPSEAARAFTPHRVHIPMTGRAESLNVAVAAGILLFEAARQKRSS